MTIIAEALILTTTYFWKMHKSVRKKHSNRSKQFKTFVKTTVSTRQTGGSLIWKDEKKNNNKKNKANHMKLLVDDNRSQVTYLSDYRAKTSPFSLFTIPHKYCLVLFLGTLCILQTNVVASKLCVFTLFFPYVCVNSHYFDSITIYHFQSPKQFRRMSQI